MPNATNGQHLSSVGGIVQFTQFGNINTGAINGSNSGFIDVAKWELVIQQFLDDTTDTGCFGGQGLDVTCQGGQFRAEVIWDLNKQPDLFQRAGAANMNMGCAVSLFVGNGLNYPESDQTGEWFFLPSAKIVKQSPINDANAKKMVRCILEGAANGLIFHMPQDATRLSQYQTHVQNRGRTW